MMNSFNELNNIFSILIISLGFILLYILSYSFLIKKPITDFRYDYEKVLLAVLLTGLLGRIVIAMAVYGHASDMSCWMGWSERAKWSGIFTLYRSDVFIDYPPGYMYFLNIIGSARDLFNITIGSQLHSFIIKIPPMIADIFTAYIIYKISVKKLPPSVSVVLSGLYVFNPAVILNSAAWGQVDSVFTLFVIAYIYYLYEQKILKASIFFVLGLLIKPQMLFFGPVLMVVFIKYLIANGWRKGLKVFLISFFSGVLLFIALILPFSIGMPWYWIFEKYGSTIASYNYINLNSNNLYMLLGLNWVPNDEVRLGMSLAFWGYIGLIFSLAFYTVSEFVNKNRNNIFLGAALLMTGIFTFGVKMHERYLFPVLILLILAYIHQKDKRILHLFILTSVSHYINTALVLYNPFLPAQNPIIWFISLLTVIGYLITVIIFFLHAKNKYSE